MAKFRATFFWTMAHTVLIEADSEDQARDKAKAEGEGISVESGGSYLSDSFELGTLEAVADGEND